MKRKYILSAAAALSAVFMLSLSACSTDSNTSDVENTAKATTKAVTDSVQSSNNETTAEAQTEQAEETSAPDETQQTSEENTVQETVDPEAETVSEYSANAYAKTVYDAVNALAETKAQQGIPIYDNLRDGVEFNVSEVQSTEDGKVPADILTKITAANALNQTYDDSYPNAQVYVGVTNINGNENAIFVQWRENANGNIGVYPEAEAGTFGWGTYPQSTEQTDTEETTTVLESSSEQSTEEETAVTESDSEQSEENEQTEE